jgi:hypothetical protein
MKKKKKRSRRNISPSDKVIYLKPTINSILNGKVLNIYPLLQEIKALFSLFFFFFLKYWGLNSGL